MKFNKRSASAQLVLLIVVLFNICIFQNCSPSGFKTSTNSNSLSGPVDSSSNSSGAGVKNTMAGETFFKFDQTDAQISALLHESSSAVNAFDDSLSDINYTIGTQVANTAVQMASDIAIAANQAPQLFDQAVVWMDITHPGGANDTSSLKSILVSGGAANTVLSGPYSRVFVSAYSSANFGWITSYPRTAFSAEMRNKEILEIRDFVAYIIKTYGSSGKAFVLKSWEGDWALMGGYDWNTVVAQDQVDAIVAWHQARQEGLRQGIVLAESQGATNANFSYAVEFNLPSRALGAIRNKNVLTDVIPRVSPDLVTYSSYQTINGHSSNEDSLDGFVLGKYWGIRSDLQKIIPLVGHPLVVSEYLFESGDFVKDGQDTQQALLALGDSGIDTAAYWEMAGGDYGLQLPQSQGARKVLTCVHDSNCQSPAISQIDLIAKTDNSLDIALLGKFPSASTNTPILNALMTCNGKRKPINLLKVFSSTKIGVRIPYSSSEANLNCDLRVLDTGKTASFSLALPLNLPAPRITSASAAGMVNKRSYVAVKGSNFGTDGDNIVTSSCAGLVKEYDGVDGVANSLYRQINVSFPSPSQATTCSIVVTRKIDNSASSESSVAIDFIAPVVTTNPAPQIPAGANFAFASGKQNGRSFASVKGLNFGTGGDNIVTSSCAGLVKEYDGVDGVANSAYRQINVSFPTPTQATNCSLSVKRAADNISSNTVNVAIDFIVPAVPAPQIVSSSASGNSGGKSYATIKGSNFGTGGDNIVTSNCAGLVKEYDGVDGVANSAYRQINVSFPTPTQATSCSLTLKRAADNISSNTVNVAIDFIVPLPPVPVIVTIYAAGMASGKSYVALKGSNFGTGGDNIVTSSCAGLVKEYDGVDGVANSAYRQINVSFPTPTQATSCDITVKRAADESLSRPASVDLDYLTN